MRMDPVFELLHMQVKNDMLHEMEGKMQGRGINDVEAVVSLNLLQYPRVESRHHINVSGSMSAGAGTLINTSPPNIEEQLNTLAKTLEACVGLQMLPFTRNETQLSNKEHNTSVDENQTKVKDCSASQAKVENVKQDETCLARNQGVKHCLCEKTASVFTNGNTCAQEEAKYGSDHHLNGFFLKLPTANKFIGGINVRKRWLYYLGITEQDVAAMPNAQVRWTHFPIEFFEKSLDREEMSKRRRINSTIMPVSTQGYNREDVIRKGTKKGGVVATPCMELIHKKRQAQGSRKRRREESISSCRYKCQSNKESPASI